ncbi:MAG: PilZ domain-containing protein [Planctomycetes bacterium]|nr:PilZ domain-containing protein [Planctomycetota bacterium]
MTGEDMRKYVRIEKEMLVRITERHLSPEETNEIETTTKNLGEGGLFVEMDNPPPKGTIVEVEFTPPHGQHPISTLGIVRWSTKEPPAAGAGIKFAPVNEKDREHLINLVKNLKKKP